MKKIFKFFALLMAVCFATCQKEHDIPLNKKPHKTDLSLIESFNSPLSMDHAVDLGDYLLIEDCYLIPKAKGVEDRQFTVNKLIALNRVVNIRVMIDASIPTAGVDNWRPAILQALDDWSNVGQCLVRFTLITTGTFDLLIRDDENILPNDVVASCEFPSANQSSNSGAPGALMRINLDFNANTPVTAAQMRHNMVHELGHCIGFRHSNFVARGEIAGTDGANQVFGTPAVDPASVMNGGTALNNWAGFSNPDIAAVRSVYSPKRIIGTSWDSEGSDLAVGNINGTGTQDLLLMAYDAASGANTFRYRIAFDLDANGNPTTQTPVVTVAGVGDVGNGAGAALGNIGGGTATDLLLFADDDVANNLNQLRYRVCFDLNTTTGVASSVSNIITVPNGGMSWNSEGAAATIGNIDSDPRPDLVLLIVDKGANANDIRYRVGYNLNTAGVATTWTGILTLAGGVSWENAGGGVAISNLGGGLQPDLIVMGYNKVANGPNEFRYRIGYDISPTTGIVTNWDAVTTQLVGLTWFSAGAGMALGNIDGNSAPELFLFSEDNPVLAPDGTGSNEFRYMVGFNVNNQGVSNTWVR
jgi:Dual-action HEIGH metallo-peptidase